MKKGLYTGVFTLLLVLFLATCAQAEAFFAGGSGMADDPFLISTEAQLLSFRDHVNEGDDYKGKYIRLTNDIEVTESGFTPIGYGDFRASDSDNRPFNGTFDGAGHAIGGVLIDDFGKLTAVSDGECAYYTAGLFGYMGGYGEIRNLSTDASVKLNVNATEKIDVYAGGLMGEMAASMQNCRATGSIEISGAGINFIRAGGLVAYLNADAVSLNRCTSTGDVTIEADTYKACIGGFIGHNDVGSTSVTMAITDCHSTGNVLITGTISFVRAGGFMGYNMIAGSDPAAIERCYSIGNVNVNTQSDDSIRAGGFIGYNQATNDGMVTLFLCDAHGAVEVGESGGAVYADAFIGDNEDEKGKVIIE